MPNIKTFTLGYRKDRPEDIDHGPAPDNSFTKVEPKTFNEYIGQSDAKAVLRDAIAASSSLDEPLPNILISSPGPGMGKTRLANIIVSEAGKHSITRVAAAIEDKSQMSDVFKQLNKYHNPVLIVDEVHNLKHKLAEMLYLPMEGIQCSIESDSAFGAGASKYITVNPFSVICLTAGEQGALPRPMLDRLSLQIVLKKYTKNDIMRIVSHSAQALKVNLSTDVLKQIVDRSCLTPRIGNNLVMRMRDYMISKHKTVVSTDVADAIFQRLGIDEQGLDYIGRLILSELYASPKGRLGIRSLASIVGVDVKTLENIYQPRLILTGMMSLMPNGRAITQKGMEHVQKYIKP